MPPAIDYRHPGSLSAWLNGFSQTPKFGARWDRFLRALSCCVTATHAPFKGSLARSPSAPMVSG